MPVDAGLGALSDQLLMVAVVVYCVAMVASAVEYAFGSRGRVARGAAAPAALVGAGVGAGAGRPGTAPGRPTGGRVVADRSVAPAAGRAAVVLTVLGALLHTASLVARGFAAGRVPWGNMYEFALAVCLAAVLGWLVLLARHPIRHLGAFILLPVVTLLGIAVSMLYTQAAPLVPALQSYWLKIHVSAAVLATGLFLLGAVTGTLFLLRQRWETRGDAARFPATLGRQLPAADVLERLTFRVIAVAFPIWTFAIICGAIWAEAAWTRYWGWDPKEVWAFISWVVYAGYLHARATGGWRGTKAVTISLVGWATMMVNLFVVNLVITGLHSYADVGG